MDTRDAILEYLSNPAYQHSLTNSGITGSPIIIDKILSSDKKFYKKRIVNLFKNACKDNDYPEAITIVHDEFVHSVIKYFKLIDTRDIIQEDHDNTKLSSQNKVLSSNRLSYEETQAFLSSANNEIMREKNTVGNLDAFVEKKKITVVHPMKIPYQKAIDLKSPTLKSKGIKPKKHKPPKKHTP